MTFLSRIILASFLGRRQAAKVDRRFRPALETLEDRFCPSTVTPVSGGPAALVSADFNGDGKLDVAVVQQTNNSVAILLGNGSGDFSQASQIDVGQNPSAIAAGDFNQDGKIDLVVANRDSNSISILINTGAGSFVRTADIATGTAPSAVVAAKLNNDATVDIAVANSGDDNVFVYAGNGTGGFTKQSRVIAVGDDPEAMVVSPTLGGNSNSRNDLAVVNQGSNNVSVLIGQGTTDASYKRIDTATGPNPTAIAGGDFNQDGFQDLVTANAGIDSLTVLYGNGNGSFVSSQIFGIDSLPDAVGVGDFNGDGAPDIAAANFNSNDVVQIFNRGDGAFSDEQRQDVSAGPSALAIGDFNKDGKDDMAIAAFLQNALVQAPGVQVPKAAPAPALSVAWSTDGTSVVAAYNNGLLRNWVAGGNPANVLTSTNDLSEAGRNETGIVNKGFVAGAADNVFGVFGIVRDKTLTVRFSKKIVTQAASNEVQFAAPITSLQFSRPPANLQNVVQAFLDQRYAVGLSNGTVAILAPRIILGQPPTAILNFPIVNTVNLGTGTNVLVSLSPDGKVFAFASGTKVVFRDLNGNVINGMPDINNASAFNIEHAAFSGDTVAASSGKVLTVTPLAGGAFGLQFQNSIISVDITKQGNTTRVAALDSLGNVTVIDTATRATVKQFKAGALATSMAFSPDGKLLAFSYKDGNVGVADLAPATPKVQSLKMKK